VQHRPSGPSRAPADASGTSVVPVRSSRLSARSARAPRHGALGTERAPQVHRPPPLGVGVPYVSPTAGSGIGGRIPVADSGTGVRFPARCLSHSALTVGLDAAADDPHTGLAVPRPRAASAAPAAESGEAMGPMLISLRL